MKILNDNIKSILSLVIVFFVFILLIIILILCRDDKTIISSIIIGLFGLASTVAGYYYGYSQGASKKDEAQAALTANSQVTSTSTSPAP